MANKKTVRAYLGIGCDLEGDACLYVTIINAEGQHVRYATDAELQRWIDSLDCGDGIQFEADEEEGEEFDEWDDDEQIECSACGDTRGTCHHAC